MQDAGIFNEWTKRLFNRRSFRATDRICDRHFTKDQILTHWDHIIDGKCVQLEREKPKLKFGAIPELNLVVQDLNNGRRPRRTSTKKRKRKEVPTKPPAVASIDDSSTATDCDNHVVADAPTTDDEDVVDVIIEQINNTNSRTAVADNAELKQKAFDMLYDEVYDVELPSTLWGIHRDPNQKFITFTRFDPVQMNCNRVLHVTNTFELQALVDGVHVLREARDELSIVFLTNTLNELDERGQQNANEKP